MSGQLTLKYRKQRRAPQPARVRACSECDRGALEGIGRCERHATAASPGLHSWREARARARQQAAGAEPVARLSGRDRGADTQHRDAPRRQCRTCSECGCFYSDDPCNWPEQCSDFCRAVALELLPRWESPDTYYEYHSNEAMRERIMAEVRKDMPPARRARLEALQQQESEEP